MSQTLLLLWNCCCVALLYSVLYAAIHTESSSVRRK